VFTLKRWVPPVLTRDWERDGPNLLRSIQEYLLSLEGKQALVIHSGTYTPTITGVTNHGASTSAVCQYLRVDDVVTVSGEIQHDPSGAAPTITEFRVSLPIASAFAATTQCAGTGARYNTAGVLVEPVVIYADTTNDEAFFRYNATNAANFPLPFSFTYTIL